MTYEVTNTVTRIVKNIQSYSEAKTVITSNRHYNQSTEGEIIVTREYHHNVHNNINVIEYLRHVGLVVWR